MKKFNAKIAISVSALALLTTACSTDLLPEGRENRTFTSERIDKTERAMDSADAILKTTEASGRPSNVKVRKGLFLGQDGFRTNNGDPLPRHLETSKAVSLHTGDKVNLFELVPILQQATGLRIDIRDLDAIPSGSASNAVQDISVPEIGLTNAGAPTTAPSGTSNPGATKFFVNYQGPLSGFLDYVSAQIGVDWTYKGGRIKFVGPQTVTYTIWALPGTTEAEGTIGGGEAFGAGTPAKTSYKMNVDYWEDIESGIKAIVPQDTAKYSINRTSGTITLTAFQAIHERIQDFIEAENARLSRQVAVKIDILSFTSSEGDTKSANLDAVLESMSAGLNFNVGGSTAKQTGTPSFGFSVIDTDGTNSKWAGTNGFIQSLAKRGKVALLNSTSIIATNNQPTPISLVSAHAYLSGMTQTDEDNGDTSTELETSVINDGLNMTLTPRILSGGEIMLNYHMSLTDLVGIEEFTSANSTVQLPETTSRSFMQTVTVDSGDAVVVAAHDSTSNSRNASGPFSPKYWGLGGQDAYSRDKTKIVIIMTPVELDHSNKPKANRR